MSVYRPKSGDVVAFGFLWSWEAERGHDRGLKRRPCLVLHTHEQESGLLVRLVPVSHRPVSKQPSIEIPKAYLHGAGLDGLGCFVIPSEVNSIAWPSRAYDRQLLPKGKLPGGFLETVQRGVVDCDRVNQLNEVDRERLSREIVEAYRGRDR